MRLPFAKNPALNAYLNSLVNLGLFESQEERTEIEEEVEDSELTFDDIELSELGLDLANAYGSSIGRIEVIKHLAGLDRTCRVESLQRLGERGGLCELTLPTSMDRDLLRSVFFAHRGFKERSHHRRNRTLTLILELCRPVQRRRLGDELVHVRIGGLFRQGRRWRERHRDLDARPAGGHLEPLEDVLLPPLHVRGAGRAVLLAGDAVEREGNHGLHDSRYGGATRRKGGHSDASYVIRPRFPRHLRLVIPLGPLCRSRRQCVLFVRVHGQGDR